MAVRDGIQRPGALERYIQGISAKVLAERLRKLVDYGLLTRNTFPEVPPRTEYSLTQAGQDLVEIIEQLRSFNPAHEQSEKGDDDARKDRKGAARLSRSTSPKKK